jgi:hypothetical protein
MGYYLTHYVYLQLSIFPYFLTDNLIVILGNVKET